MPGGTTEAVSNDPGTVGSAQSTPAGLSDDPALNSAVTNTGRLIGQQLWNQRVTLLNHEQPVFELAPHAIKLLTIEDSYLNWPLQGTIIIDARYESFERAFSDNFVHLRSDGRLEILIEIWPSVRDGELPDDIWKIVFTGSVYDIEDIAHDNVTTKAKKLYFWDKRFQFIQEQTLQWSTATGKRYKSPEVPAPKAHATDEERSMYTGEAIASLFEAAGFEEFIDFDEWEMGACKISYVAKANWSVWDNIQYIMQQQISDDNINDICILDWSRAKEKIQLVPFWKIFELAGDSADAPGELQIEHLFFEARSMELRDEKPRQTSPWKAPYLSAAASKSIDIKISEYNTILNYQFVQTSGIDSSKGLITKPVYSHWHNRKQFDVDVKENEIKDIKKNYFTPNYVDKLLGKEPVFVLNKTKTEQLAIEPVFSPISTLNPETDRLGRSVFGKGKILYAGIYLNQCMVVRLQGSTHRLAGTFVGIDRLNEDSDTDYDYQVCGQYLVVEVKHIMRQQSYVTDLTLVKINAYDKLKNSNEEIF